MTPQHLLALESANRRRMAVAQLRAELRQSTGVEARDRVIALLDAPAGDVVSAKIGWLLNAIPGVGRRGLTHLLHRAQIISADRHLADLTERQREALAQALRDWALIAPHTRWSR